MATYKIVDTEQLDSDITSVADAIRLKGNTTGELSWPDGFVSRIENMTSFKTATGRLSVPLDGETVKEVNCGFKPDIISFFNTYYNNNYYNDKIVISERFENGTDEDYQYDVKIEAPMVGRYISGVDGSTEYDMFNYWVYVKLTENGFKMKTPYRSSYGNDVYLNSFNYLAIKYTP